MKKDFKKRRLPEAKYKMVAVPTVAQLPGDPAWEKKETALARHATRKLPVPKD